MIKETGEQSERALFMSAKKAYFARKGENIVIE
jgi:hypothetical protein